MLFLDYFVISNRTIFSQKIVELISSCFLSRSCGVPHAFVDINVANFTSVQVLLLHYVIITNRERRNGEHNKREIYNEHTHQTEYDSDAITSRDSIKFFTLTIPFYGVVEYSTIPFYGVVE